MKEKIFRAKKSLGQNFLKSESALRGIVAAGDINDEDTILEIGPGKGALTEKLLERARKVIAIEKDRELFEFLKEKFKKEIGENTLVLLNDDILEFDISKNSLQPHYKIIANIPYNITGAILKKFLTADQQPERMVLMVQKEVAERIIGREKESILSISVKAYGKPSMVMKVPKRYFSPSPKVDSAIIKIEQISRKIFTEDEVNEGKFWEIVKNGFAHKRKMLSGNLKGTFSPEELEKSMIGTKRAEDLKLSDWIALARI